jgi:hypothetical protein
MSVLGRLKIRRKLASMVVLSALTVCAIIALSASERATHVGGPDRTTG